MRSTCSWPSCAALVTASFGLVACEKSAPPPRVSTEAEACLETWIAEPPEGEPAREPERPLSRLWLKSRIPTADLLAEVERQVPRQLVKDRRQSVGIAGVATYSVRRLGPSVHAHEQGIEVRVPLEASIEVCKPFGGTCIRYGSCQPSFLASIRTQSFLGSDYALPTPRAFLEATRPCVIGLDVTPQILSEARKELRGVEQQLARSLPELKPWAAQLWQSTQIPLPIVKDECLRFTPQSLAHAPAQLAGEHLELSAGIEGTLSWTSCGDDVPRSSLPPLTHVGTAPESSELWWPQRVELHTLAEAIDSQLVPPEGSRSSGIEVRSLGARLGIAIRWEGQQCGTSWLSAEPRLNAATSQLELGDIRTEAPVSGTGSELTLQAAELLAAVRLPADTGAEHARDLLLSFLAVAERALPDLKLEVQIDPPSRRRTWMDADGLWVATAIEPQAELSFSSPRTRLGSGRAPDSKTLGR